MVYRNGYAVIPNPNYKEYPNYGPRRCIVCGAQLIGRQRYYCGPECNREWWIHGLKEIKLYWSELRQRILLKHKFCDKCGSTEELEVHHIIPLYLGGEQFDEKNLRVLCRKCHDYEHRTLPKTINRLHDRDRGIEHYIQMTFDTLEECSKK